MKKTLTAIILILVWAGAGAQQVEYSLDKDAGYIDRISIAGDGRGMNWIMATDGSQYPWVGRSYGWGLGEFTLYSEAGKEKTGWWEPVHVSGDDSVSVSVYRAGVVGIAVTRRIEAGDLVEAFVFTNTGPQAISVTDVVVNTPFNDNYPDAETCYHGRTNAHIWAGKQNAYVNAMHMSGNPPHLGLVLTRGSVTGYEVCERDAEKGLSNTRGVIRLVTENMLLEAGESYTLEWRLFSHVGQEDFYSKIVGYGSVVGSSPKYVYEVGETASAEFLHNGSIGEAYVLLNGEEVAFEYGNGRITVSHTVEAPGELDFILGYGAGEQSHVKCLAVSSVGELIERRVGFIIDRQQYDNSGDARDGAYMVYDNELKEIYMNDGPWGPRSDCDEGRERLGMGVLLTLQYQRTGDDRIKESLLKYAGFVESLQREDYTTFSTADHKSKDRAYNYPWVANFWFGMFGVTNDRDYLLRGYYTLKAMYRRHGHEFYAIDIPVKGYRLLEENGYVDEARSLLGDFTKNADAYAANGWNYPKSEVNYEQSIVAPAIIHLLRVYLVTGEEKYLEAARVQLPLLESFGGLQPDYHLNEIAIRHWDGYWFGKYRLWGDTFPHYWSALTGVAYHLYYRCTGDESYLERAENIVRNNLCLFFEDGSASCTFIYPGRVDGRKAHLFDPFANDQDWALVYYLSISDPKFVM